MTQLGLNLGAARLPDSAGSSAISLRKSGEVMRSRVRVCSKMWDQAAVLSGLLVASTTAGCHITLPSSITFAQPASESSRSEAERESEKIQLASASSADAGDAVRTSKYQPPPQELPFAVEPREGRQIYPLDLSTAMRLGDANSLEVQIARNRYESAVLRENAARAMWLPDLIVGPTYQYHDGQIQRAIGEILDTRRNSLSISGGPVLSWDLSETLYARLTAHQITHARSASVGATRNQALLDIAEGYFDLLAAHATIAIAQETLNHAQRLSDVTASFAKREVGLPSDAARAQTELQFRKQQLRLAQERSITSSAALARRLHLDAQIQLVPIETKLVPVEIYPVEADPAAFVELALRNRPEIEEGRWLVGAASCRVEQAGWAPLLPKVQVGYQAGGFGGGYVGDPKGFFNSFDTREDLQATAVWQIRNLGLGDRSRLQGEQLELENAQLQLSRVTDRVVEEVVSSHETVSSRKEQLEIARLSVSSAVDSLHKNVQRISEGAGLPIEALQSLQALDKARIEFLMTLTSYNKAQFRLFTASGNTVLDADFVPAK